MTTAYYTNPLRGVTNAKLDKVLWSGRVAWNVPYQRGMIYFVDLEQKLRARGAGFTVLDLVNATSARIRAGAPQTNRTWEEELQRRAGSWAVADWRAMLAGRLIVPASDAFGPCFERHARNMGLFDLGFARPVAVRAGETVTGVDPVGPAARAGLHDGDVITRAIDLNAPSEQVAQPITLAITRAGRAMTIRYDPHEGSVSGYEWRPKVGGKCFSGVTERAR